MPGPPSIVSQTRTGLRYFFNEQLMQGFAGGLNLRDAPTELKPSESPSSWNVTLDERGGVVKRLGYSKWNATAADNLFQDSYYSLLTGLMFWYSPADGKLYKDSAGTLTNVHTFTAGSRVSLIDFAGKTYCGHPVDGLYESADGTTWTATTKGTHTADIPKGSLLAVWQNKLWIAGDPAHLNRVWFSGPGDATDYDTADGGGSVDIREKDDASIVAIHGGSGIDFQTEPGLFVFKRDSTYRITDSATGAYLSIDGSVGAASKNSITQLYGELIFISRRGIYATKKLSAIQPVCEQILPLFDPDSTDDTKLDNFCAGYVGDRVYFSVTRQGASVNDIALEYAPLYGWVVAGSNAMGCYQSRTGDAAEIIVGASPTVTGQLYRLNDGGSDDGADVASWYETRWFEVLNGHEARMSMARILFRGADVTCTLYTDFSQNGEWTDTLDNTTAGMVWNVDNWGESDWGGQTVETYQTTFPRKIARAFKLRFDETSSETYSKPALLGSGASLAAGAWALYSVESQYVPLGLS